MGFELEKVDDVGVGKPAEDEVDAIEAHTTYHVVREMPGNDGHFVRDLVQLNASIVRSQEEPVAPIAPEDPLNVVIFSVAGIKRVLAFSRHCRHYLCR